MYNTMNFTWISLLYYYQNSLDLFCWQSYQISSFIFSCFLQVLNPLFDSAGLTRGHSLFPFWTYFAVHHFLAERSFKKAH